MEDFQYDTEATFGMENPYCKTTCEKHISDDRVTTNKTSANCVYRISNRLVICIFAMCFLWTTSLQICVTIVDLFIAIPSFSSVKANCALAYNTAENERIKYRNCVNGGLYACESSLSTAFQYESLRVADTANSNAQISDMFTSLVNNCSTSLSESKQAVNSWTTLGVAYTIPYKNQCAGSDKETVNDLLGETTTSKSSLFSTSQLYSEMSDNRVAHLADYAVALNDYNIRYLNNKTRSLQRLADNLVLDVSLPHIDSLKLGLQPIYGILDVVVDCIGLGNGTCIHEINARALYDQMQVYINARLDYVFDIFVEINATMSAFRRVLSAALGAADLFYDSVTGIRGIITWIVNNTNGLFSINAQLCGRTSPSWCDFNKLDWFVMPPNLPDMPNLPIVEDAEIIWDAVKDVVVDARVSISASIEQLEEQLIAMVNDISEAIENADFTPDDYNPPSYPLAKNYTAEREQQAALSSEFLSAMQNILNRVDVNTSYFDSFSSIYLNTTANVASSFALSSFSVSWVNISFGGMDVSALLASIATIRGLCFLFDYLYRIFQTVRLVGRFWGRGLVTLPALDMRTNKEVTMKGLNYIGYFLQILPFIWLQLLIVMFFAALIMWSTAAVLIPEYNGYINACVEHTANDTFISDMLHSVAFNYASFDGNTDIAKGVLQYNAQLAAYCTSNSLSSAQKHNKLIETLLTANQTLHNELSKVAAINSCVGLSELDRQFAEACCGASSFYDNYWQSQYGQSACQSSSFQCPVSNAMTGAKYLPPGAYLEQSLQLLNSSAYLHYTTDGDNSAVLSNYMGVIQNSIFQCTTLPQCTVSCTGPDMDLLDDVAKGCACMSEWYFNGYVIQISVAIVAYLLMNVSRGLIVSGVLRIWWKSLSPKLFDVSASCDLDGKIMLAPKAVKHVRKKRKYTECSSPSQSLCDSDKHRVRFADKPSGSGEVMMGSEDDDENTLSDSDDTASVVTAPENCSSGNSGKSMTKDTEDRATVVKVITSCDQEAVMAALLNQRVTSFVRQGYAMVALGFAMNIPWLALVYLTKQNLAYIPDEGGA